MFPARRFAPLLLALLLAACSSFGAPAASPTPILTETAGQRAAAYAGQIFTHYERDDAGCRAAFAQGKAGTCVYPVSITPVRHPAWDQLFPQAALYEIAFRGLFAPGTVLPPGDSSDISYAVVAAQGGDYFRAEDFPRLLTVNQIQATDANREQIAQAFALLTLRGYLTDAVTFEKLAPVTKPASEMRYPYNYQLQAATRLGGYTIRWWLVYGAGGLEVASGPIVAGQNDQIGKALPSGERQLLDKDYEFIVK